MASTRDEMASDATPHNTPDPADVPGEEQEPADEPPYAVAEFEAAKWEANRDGTYQSDRPEVFMWLVHDTTRFSEIGSCREVWAMGGADNPNVKGVFDKVGMAPDGRVRNCRGGFCQGLALTEEQTATIRPCWGKDLSRYAFRVTHEGTPDGRLGRMPHRGFKARGFKKLKTDPMHIQDIIQLHLNPNWRGKSPFISVAGTLRLAGIICAEYIKKGCQGIKLHVIKMSGEGWDPHKQRIFRVADLARQFGFRMRKAYESEYLIESEIPAACVIETMDISDISAIPRHWEYYTTEGSDALGWEKKCRDFMKLIEAARRLALKDRLEPQKAEKFRHGTYESRKRTKDFRPMTERYY